MENEELTGKIIKCAYDVHNKMGFGYLESVYERCMMIELAKAGLDAKAQQPIRVTYEQVCVGDFFADIIVSDTVIVELKSVARLLIVHEAQLVNYLTATNKPLGLLINFGPERVGVRRKYRDSKVRQD
jgi:GxxExxY protein